MPRETPVDTSPPPVKATAVSSSALDFNDTN